jgi:Right handed beta helix region
MRTFNIQIMLLTALLTFALGCGRGSTPSTPPPKGATSYYVECSAATDGDGTEASPWNSLSSTNAISFGPGDQLLLKRGTTCQGALSPVGSGSSDATIVIDSYGTGAQPIIDGGTSNAVISLTDQQYWEIRNLEIVGGNKFGVFISGNTPNSSLNHFHLVNLNVHGALYTSTNTRDFGEVFISPAGVHQIVNDVLLDGVSAHDTQVSEGIIVESGGDFNTQQAACQQTPTPANALGNSVTIQNSTAHDVYGDGILILAVSNGLMQNNVVYHSGLCPNCGRTTSGLWQWCCHSCTIQGNESYANKTGGGPYDGGDFDIDLYNNDNSCDTLIFAPP